MNREAEKFKFNARTLDDAIIKDGLEAVSVLNDKEKYFLVGGIATQGYLPTKARRPTSDIDFAILRPLSKPDFREMIRPVREYLQDLGYKTTQKIAGRARSYALSFSDPNGGEAYLEFVRRNKQNFKKHEARLEREFENTRMKIIEEREATYKVCSPEDIAVPKLVRSINSLSRNPRFSKIISPRQEPLSSESIKRRLRGINGAREEAVSNPGDAYLAERLRFISDIYDIRILSEITGFNKKYFLEAQGDWRDICENPELRDRIFEIALPKFLENAGSLD